VQSRRHPPIGIFSTFRQLGDWLDQPGRDDPTLTENRPSRGWFGAVQPGTAAPVIDSAGVDGKIAGMAAIRAHDPAFSEEVFLAQVVRLFFAVLGAWTGLKPALSQGVMAPIIWEQQRAQIEAYRAGGRRNLLDGLSLTSANVAGAATDGKVDTLTVRINAASADCDVDAGGQVVKGSTSVAPWTEDWIFQRPASLATASPGTIVSQECPNCGARVTVDITSICPFCGAAVISGRFGWLLARIDRVL
jgi:inner membrane protein import complex subunit Tim44-like protein